LASSSTFILALSWAGREAIDIITTKNKLLTRHPQTQRQQQRSAVCLAVPT
jgi:hypothetical protein